VRKAHFQLGRRTDAAYVFSAPGQKEENATCPVSGTTGQHLDQLIEILATKGLSLPPRQHARITNAWDGVEFKGRTGRTKAGDNQILNKLNLARLAAELADISQCVICFGKKAKLAVDMIKDRLQPGCEVIYAQHLSPQSINRIKQDLAGQPILNVKQSIRTGDQRPPDEIGRDNTRRRLEVVAAEILGSLQTNPGSES